MKKDRMRRVCMDILFEIVGSLLIGIALFNFALTSEFPVTGFSGIAMIMYRLWGLPIGATTLVLNIPVAIICFRLLGKRFFVSSLRCMVISSFCIDYISPLLPLYYGNRMLSAICVGVISGIGYALIYMRNSSTGGADFITLSIKRLAPHIPLGSITFILDAGVVVAAGLIFNDIDGIIYGLLINYIVAIVLDKVMFGINSGKMTLIVTTKGKEICDAIDECSQRGSTILAGYGGYKQDEKDVVMCVSNSKQMVAIEHTVKEVDPESFMIILESNEVVGNGFKRLQL